MAIILQQLRAFIYQLPWMSRRRQSSLLMRLMMIASCWGVLIFLLAFVSLWWTANQVIQDSIRRQSFEWLNKFDELGTPLLLSGDAEQFDQIRYYTNSFREISYLRYLSADGKTELACYLAPGVERELIQPFTEKELAFLQKFEGGEKPRLATEFPQSSLLRVSAPAVVRSIATDGLLNYSLGEVSKEDVKIIGYVDVGLNFSIYRENLWRHILYGSILTFGLFFITFLLGRIVIQRALRPLDDLQVPLGKLARGETDIQVEHSGTKEIMAIGNALNTTIAALKARDQELSRLANFDPLTGLLNRRNFSRELEREKARTLLEERTSALLFVDLDRFKEVNDTAGHAAGDELLIQVGQLLRSTVRSSDIVARLGGDEFTIILVDVQEPHAGKVAEQICNAMNSFVFVTEGHNFNIQCSIGITMIGSDVSTASTLLSHADTACHEAKKTGRNRYCHYRDRTGTGGANGKGLRSKIEGALRDKTLQLSYCPIHDAHQAEIRSCQGVLLVRTADEVLLPSSYVSSAERFDLMQDLDRVAIQLALDALQGTEGRGKILLRVSGKTILQGDILDFIRKALCESSCDPGRLIFEVSERALLENVTQAKDFMEGVRELGGEVAVGDFGVSLNSINLLKGLPINYIKLNDILVRNIEKVPFNQTLVAAIVQIAMSLKLRVAAEAVETAAEASCLEQLGVELFQGDLVGRCQEMFPAAKTWPA